jgi:RHS repeat-associated protein
MFATERIARRDSSGTVYYLFADHLGTARVMTNSTGAIQQQSDYYPFGGERVVANNVANTYKFTGKERDAETGNDNFGARFYGSNMGRFMIVDPSRKSTDLSNPQSWNRYAYSLNNPINYVDRNGLWPTWVFWKRLLVGFCPVTKLAFWSSLATTWISRPTANSRATHFDTRCALGRGLAAARRR